MKRIIFLAFLFSLISIDLLAQWSLSGNTITSGQYLGVNNNVVLEFRRNANTVLSFDENDNINLGRNNSISLDFSNSVAIGNNIDFYNQDMISNTFALGTNIYDQGAVLPYYIGTTQIFPTASITIGSGINSSNKLIGPGDGLAVGFNSNVPTLYVGASLGTIGSTGNVGIATTSPTQKLDVNGGIKLGNTTVASNGSIRYTGTDFEGYTNGTWKSFTSSSGNWVSSGSNIYSSNTGSVGIGINAPQEKLDINGAIRMNGNAIYFLAGSPDPHYLIKSRNWNEGMEYRHYGGHLFYTMDNKQRMIINSTGDLGLGTQTPENADGWNRVLNTHGQEHSKIVTTTQTYNVQTGIYSHAFGFFGSNIASGMLGTKSNHPVGIISNGSIKMNILTNGNVGIGTLNPTQKLEVKGNIVLGNATDGNRWIFESESWNNGQKLHIASNKSDGTWDWDNQVTIEKSTGKVVIGGLINSSPGNYRLYVQDGILTEKVKVAIKNTSNWADYVFDNDYKLRSLSEVEDFIIKNKHLPEVPCAEDVVENGLDVAQMDAILLKKIEELTLYVLEQNKRIEKLEQENKSLRK